VTLVNCDLVENLAKRINGSDGQGGGVFVSSIGSFTATNCIFWQNEDASGTGPNAQIASAAGGVVNVTYSIWEGYSGSTTSNLNANPQFKVNPSPGANGWGDSDDDYGDLHLLLCSPAVDSGLNSAPGLPPSDLEGNPRIIDGDLDGTAVVDRGVYELILPACSSPLDCSASGGQVCCNGTCQCQCCSDANCGAQHCCPDHTCHACCVDSHCTNPLRPCCINGICARCPTGGS
jgi:hypothetical protein